MVMDTVAHNYQQQTVWIINTETDKSKSLQESEQHDVQFEKAVSETGTGMFHITIAIVCGFCFMAAGLQNNLNAYILPSAGCDMKLTSNEMGLLNAVFLAGGLSSGFIWGVLADMIGRKKVLITGMVVDATLVLLSSFSQRFFVLLVFRYLNGFIIGGPSALVLAYMGEFFSEKLRTKVICYVGLLWTLSWVIMPGVAWLVIPMQFHFTFGDGIVFNSWRLLVALVGFPSILSAFLLYLYPESPRWLLSQGRAQEARDVLANVYSWNTGESADKYPVKSLCCEEKTSTTNKESSSAWQAISMLIQQGQSLFVMPVLKTTALTSALMFANMFGYYGLGLWLPELFNRFENHYAQHPHTSVSVCELSSTLSSSASDFQTCDSTAVDTTVFLNSLIIGVAGLSGNLASGFLSGKLQRRTMPIVLQLLSGLCVLTIYYLTNSFQNLIVSAAFQLCVGTANLVYNSLVVDMFPPSISGMGVCLAILSGRLGAMVSNLVFGHLLDISCAVPILLVAAVSAGGGLLSFFIPNEPYSEDKTSEEKKSVPA